MGTRQIQNQVASMRTSLFSQGYLDKQFIQLEELEDDSNPNFVEDVVSLFFSDIVRHVNYLQQEIDKCPINFHKLDGFIYSFKGSSSSIGAIKVKDACSLLSQHTRDQNSDGVIKAFEQMKNELATLKTKLEAYFQMTRQVRTIQNANRHA